MIDPFSAALGAITVFVLASIAGAIASRATMKRVAELEAELAPFRARRRGHGGKFVGRRG